MYSTSTERGDRETKVPETLGSARNSRYESESPKNPLCHKVGYHSSSLSGYHSSLSGYHSSSCTRFIDLNTEGQLDTRDTY